MEFEKRLERAIERGQRVRDRKGRAAAEEAMSEEDLKTLHSRYRLELSDHVESCLKRLADYFPGFQFQTVVGEEGWGARISRDDLVASRGAAQSLYSRLEMLVRPFTSSHIIELAAKGTIRNKEALNRNHFQFLSDADLESYRELIDLWVLEYAEKFAAEA